MSEWRCPLCAGDEPVLLFESVPVDAAFECRFTVARCRACGLFVLHPRPQREELLSFYPPDYEPFWPPLAEERSHWRRLVQRRHYAVRDAVVRCAQPGGGWLLDIGCGTGGFVHYMACGGDWRGVGLDVNMAALRLARRQPADVFCSDLDGIPLPTGTFDVVTMWEVLEHLPDPRSALAEIRRLLKPRGKLLLSTPNGASWTARIWGRFWVGWDAPRHWQVFSIQTLYDLLRASGFVPVRRLALPVERFFFAASARRWLAAILGRDGRWIDWLCEGAGWALWPATRWLDRLPSASSLIVEAAAGEIVDADAA